MTVEYVYKITQWNPNISLEDVVEFYGANRVNEVMNEQNENKFTYTDKDCMCHERLVDIPYKQGHAFGQKLKQFADVKYHIIAVKDVPVDAENRVIDGTHKDFKEEQW